MFKRQKEPAVSDHGLLRLQQPSRRGAGRDLAGYGGHDVGEDRRSDNDEGNEQDWGIRRGYGVDLTSEDVPQERPRTTPSGAPITAPMATATVDCQATVAAS